MKKIKREKNAVLSQIHTMKIYALSQNISNKITEEKYLG